MVVSLKSRLESNKEEKKKIGNRPNFELRVVLEIEEEQFGLVHVQLCREACDCVLFAREHEAVEHLRNRFSI